MITDLYCCLECDVIWTTQEVTFCLLGAICPRCHTRGCPWCGTRERGEGETQEARAALAGSDGGHG